MPIIQSTSTRLLTLEDQADILALFLQSEYRYQRFTDAELADILLHYPAIGLWQGNQLQACLLSQTILPPNAWIAGITIRNSLWRDMTTILTELLMELYKHLRSLGCTMLYYSCGSSSVDCFRSDLETHGWLELYTLYTYEKYNYTIPAAGNQEIHIRLVRDTDCDALLQLDQCCFSSPWRIDRQTLLTYMHHYPYFVVVEDSSGTIVGYQCNTIDGASGYLVRIAVDPQHQSQAIGIRLLAEALHFFAEEQVVEVILNTPKENIRAHQLYEWFDFQRLPEPTPVLGYNTSQAQVK